MRQPRGLYMDFNSSVQQVVESQRLNKINCFLLYVTEEQPKQLNQDEIIGILDQAKTRNPEWNEEMVNAQIDTFKMSFEGSISSFKSLDNLEKIKSTKVPG
jgi:hypothetical protein